ncbi:CYTH domain-containing protein [bacterium]|nr:CYTH domain-containing protein [bacterium]
MTKEIERKFLLKNDSWRENAVGTGFRQGYLPTRDECVVRVRIAGYNAYLTIKGRNVGISRLEFEYAIPVSEADSMLDKLCVKPIIEKTRYNVSHEGLLWEIDVFTGENEGLILAEIELNTEEQQIQLPEWIGEEVSEDPKYYNSNLVKNPYCNW